MSDYRIRFDGRVAVVTGAGAGLGREYALLLGSRGAKVVVNDLGGSPDGLGSSGRVADIVVDEIKGLGGTAVADYNSVVDGAKVIETAIKNFGRVDILINNAGILRDRSIVKISDADWDLVNDVHLKGSFKTTQAAWPHMKKQNYGRIIMTSSNSGLYGNFGQANYSAAKMGLIGLTNTVALEGRKYNIHCNAILPTAASRLTQGIMPDILYNELKPELIAPVVAYLVHESCENNASYIESAAGWATKVEYHRGPGVMLRKSKDHLDITPEWVRERWSLIGEFSEAEIINPLTRNKAALMNIIEDITCGDFIGFRCIYKYGPKDVVLYALSIGANIRNKLDLKFIYENHPNFSVFPTFHMFPANTILKDHDIILRAFDYKISSHDLLAGEYFMEVYDALPTSGTRHTNTKVVDTVDKGSGAICVKNTDIADSRGKNVAFIQSIIYVLKAGKLARNKSSSNTIIPTVRVPSREADCKATLQTKENQAALHRLLGDTNPHNIDENSAIKSGFERPALHGICTMGFAVREILNQYADNNPHLFKSVKVRFTAPVYPGAKLHIHMWHVKRRIHFRVLLDSGKIAIDGAYVDLKDTASSKL